MREASATLTMTRGPDWCFGCGPMAHVRHVKPAEPRSISKTPPAAGVRSSARAHDAIAVHTAGSARARVRKRIRVRTRSRVIELCVFACTCARRARACTHTYACKHVHVHLRVRAHNLAMAGAMHACVCHGDVDRSIDASVIDSARSIYRARARTRARSINSYS